MIDYSIWDDEPGGSAPVYSDHSCGEGHDFEAIRRNHPLYDVVVASGVALKRTGREWKGLCPFHAEKSPSFAVYDDQRYHCFGCGATGDVVDYVAGVEGTTLAEASRSLSGGDLPRLSDADRQRLREENEARQKLREIEREKAQRKAVERWEKAEPAPESIGYLIKKNVEPHGCRHEGKNLLVPIFDREGDILSVQSITPESDKFFQKGAPTKGGRYTFGIYFGRTIICEGFATGASIADAVSEQVCVAFNKDNVAAIAREFSEQGRTVVIAADRNAEVKMRELSAELRCAMVMPPAEAGDDFNDMAQSMGADAVRKAFADALKEHAVTEVATREAEDAGCGDLPCSIEGVDLTNPPGFVGDVARWIDTQTLRPRKHLAVAAALVAIGNIGGLRYCDDVSGITSNLFAFCVAGARSGKEGIQQGAIAIMREAGVAAATHGSIKSEQEVTRNLIRHQASFYVVDEVGLFLAKIKNAQARGGASYLEGVPAVLMSAYGKANGYMLLTGDAKEDLRQALMKELAAIERRLEEGDRAAWIEGRKASIERSLLNIDNGIERPFVSMMGMTTPVTFDGLMDYEMATNGFIGRALIFNERETVPRARDDFRKPVMPEDMASKVRQMWLGGSYDSMATDRVEYYEEREPIPTDQDAKSMLKRVSRWMEDQADEHKALSGLEAVYLGAYELVAKVSLILALPGKRRTVEHVRWAFTIVKRDIEDKIRLVVGNDNTRSNPKQALRAKIVNIVGDNGEKESVVVNRLRGFKPDDARAEIQAMVEAGVLDAEEMIHPANKRTYRYITRGTE